MDVLSEIFRDRVKKLIESHLFSDSNWFPMSIKNQIKFDCIKIATRLDRVCRDCNWLQCNWRHFYFVEKKSRKERKWWLNPLQLARQTDKQTERRTSLMAASDAIFFFIAISGAFPFSFRVFYPFFLQVKRKPQSIVDRVDYTRSCFNDGIQLKSQFIDCCYDIVNSLSSC